MLDNGYTIDEGTIIEDFGNNLNLVSRKIMKIT